ERVRGGQVGEQLVDALAGAGDAGLGHPLAVLLGVEPPGVEVLVKSLYRGVPLGVADSQAGRRSTHAVYGAPRSWAMPSAICQRFLNVYSSSPCSWASRSAWRCLRASIRCSMTWANACRGRANNTNDNGTDRTSAMMAPRKPLTPTSQSSPKRAKNSP